MANETASKTEDDTVRAGAASSEAIIVHLVTMKIFKINMIL